MKVEIFSDVVCPWCAIGKRRFESALKMFDHADEVEVIWRSYELDPQAPTSYDGDYYSRMMTKFHMSREQALANAEQMTARAAVEGLDFRLEIAKRGNTFDAHRLLHLRGREVGVQGALKERLLLAYFTEGEAIADRETLVRLAEQVGLDAVKTSELLASNRYGADVRADEREATELGINGVPFFVIDRQYGISGAQEPRAILEVLEQAWKTQQPLKVVQGNGGEACDDDSCSI